MYPYYCWFGCLFFLFGTPFEVFKLGKALLCVSDCLRDFKWNGAEDIRKEQHTCFREIKINVNGMGKYNVYTYTKQHRIFMMSVINMMPELPIKLEESRVNTCKSVTFSRVLY